MGRREGMMHRAERSVLSANAQGEIRDPDESACTLEDHLQASGYVLPDSIESGVAHVLRPGDEQTEHPLAQREFIRSCFGKEFCGGSFNACPCALEPDETAGAG